MRVSRLPAIVKPCAGAGFYSASNKIDMMRLASALRSLNNHQRIMVAAGMVDMRVMFPPLMHRLPAWIWVKRGYEELAFWIKAFSHPRVGPIYVDRIIEDAARWAINGKDREDSNSVGGFSQREVNFIAMGIALIRGDLDRKEAA